MPKGWSLDRGLLNTKVLIIDDDAQIRRLLRDRFELGTNFRVIEAEGGTVGLRAVIFEKPDLVILDPALPDIDGSDLLEQIRSWSNVSIIVLSTEANELEKVRLLRLGADDYVVKPFGMLELLARSEAILRRQPTSANRPSDVRVGDLSLDLVTRAVSVAGGRVKLTRKEYALLQTLAMHAGLVVTHNQLISKIWGASKGDIRYLRILVRKLRSKVEADPKRPSLIVSESGVGYRLAKLLIPTLKVGAKAEDRWAKPTIHRDG